MERTKLATSGDNDLIRNSNNPSRPLEHLGEARETRGASSRRSHPSPPPSHPHPRPSLTLLDTASAGARETEGLKAGAINAAAAFERANTFMLIPGGWL